ncbi:MAG: N-methyl-L-tryptophan oxidase [Candidatus Xenobia bacterium]
MRYDVIVLGIGAMGSATLRALRRRGVCAIGLEQFSMAHDRGSSHGETRLIRKAYFEDPEYIPLLHAVYPMWRELQAEHQETLFEERTGLLLAGAFEHDLVQRTLKTARKYNVPLESLTAEQCCQRWPMLRMPDGLTVLWDEEGGVLRVEACVRALAHGAEVREHVTVQNWKAGSNGVEVTTSDGTFEADRLVVTAGAWAAKLLGELGRKLWIRRKVLFWHPQDGAYDGAPAFFYALDYGQIYGFPGRHGLLKLADHAGGQVLDDPDPARDLLPGDHDTVARAIAELFPHASAVAARHVVCMYTMTPDENFILDLHPEHRNVAFAAGFSGHGFKFAPLIGEIMADLVLTGQTQYPVGFLRLR